MTQKKRFAGVAAAGLSMTALLFLSGMAFAQDLQSGPDILIDDFDLEVIDLNAGDAIEGGETIDPICIECSGTGPDGSGDEIFTDEYNDDEFNDDDFSDDGDTGSESPGDDVGMCEGDVCQDSGMPEMVNDDFDPVILYTTGAGDPTVEGADNIRSGSKAGTNALQRGPDLCISPAQELVWLCELVNGKL